MAPPMVAARRGGRGSGGAVLALEGPSGAGKSSAARALSGSFGYYVVAEAYDRLDPRPSLEVRHLADLVSVESDLLGAEVERYHEAEEARRAGRSVVLDTGYLGPFTYTLGLAEIDPRFRPAVRPLARRVLSLIRRGSLGLPDGTIYLDVPESHAADRASRDPVRHPPRWARRHREVARFERRLWLGPFEARAPKRFWRLPSLPSPEEVARRVDRACRRGRFPGRPSGALAAGTVRSWADFAARSSNR